MLQLCMLRRFLVAQYSVDFRKGHASLLGEARRLGLEPYAGDLVAFVSGDRTKVKALFGDESGLTLVYKVFSKGTLKTQIRFLQNPSVQDVSYAEIAMLLQGSSYTLHKHAHKWLPGYLR
jgi:hypothetical protein